MDRKYSVLCYVNASITPPKMIFNENDTNTCIIEFTCYESSGVVLEGITRAVVSVTRPNASESSYDATFVDNVVTFTVPNGAINAEGVYNGQMYVYGSDNQRLTMSTFKYTVLNELLNSEVVVDDTEFPILTSLIGNVNDIEATISGNEVTRQQNESDRQSSETTRISAFTTNETNRSNTFNASESSRTTTFNASELSRTTGESARQSAEDIRVSSENTRLTNEISRVNAEASRVSAEANRVTVEASRVSAESARATGYNAMVQASYVIPRAPVATFADIATTYPVPINGWSTRAIDTGKVYRYNSFNSTWEWVDTITASSYDALLNQVQSANMSTPTDYTAIITSLPNTANMGELKTMIKGRTSDTTTITTDFNHISTGGSGDALNATMKLYKGSVDPLALPVPTDALWQQVTDVSKLKTQNETPITSTNTSARTAVYNGKTLVVQSASQPAVRDDFAGKVLNNTSNPNKSYISYMNTLQPPTNKNSPTLGFYDLELDAKQFYFDRINTLDGTTQSFSVNTNGQIPQQLFSFDLIRITEDKYGTIPSADQTVAGKVAWLKANVLYITPKWYGYGLCPSGNKAYLKGYDNTNSVYYTGVNHTVNTPTILTATWGGGAISQLIDNNGFVNMLACTDASDGVTASTIYTDYINIELQFKPVVGYDLLVDTNPRRDSGMADMVSLQKVFNPITDDFAGKISGSDTVCANVAKYVYADSLRAPSEAFVGEMNYSGILSLNGICDSASTSVNTAKAQQLFSFNLIRMFKDAMGYDIPIDYTGVPATDLANQVQWLKDNCALSLKWTGFGSCPSGNKANLVRWNNGINNWNGTVFSNTSSSPTELTYASSNPISDAVDANGFAHYLAYTDASNGTIASTINTDYIKLDLTFKNPNNAMLMFTNASVELENLTSGKSEALLVELDLGAICTNLFGGDNAKMKSALKSISVDAWAMGSGALKGALGYEVDTKVWDTSGGWNLITGIYSNKTPSIVKITQLSDSVTYWANHGINSSSKLYTMIYAPYTSDGVIPSQVSLDYVKTTVSLTRVLSESAYKVRSCGKNLFDKSKARDGYTVNVADGTPLVLANYSISDYISAKAGLIYTKNIGTTLCAYDSNKNFISSGSIPFTLPAGTAYMRSGMLTTDKDTLQIEQNSTSTAYEPHKFTESYTPPVELRSVGSVTDTFDVNSGLMTKRVEQKVLQASDVTNIVSDANVDHINISKQNDSKGYGNGSTGIYNLEGYTEFTDGVGYDNVSNIGKFNSSISTALIVLVVAKGTYTTLAQAQTALTGKKLTYVLTTPTTTQYDAQTIDAYPSGTVYCEPMIRDTFKYTTKVDIANTLYPIKALTKVYKVISNAGEEVVLTPIDVSTCTVAGDGLSFTSTALALNDMVEYEYEFEAWRTLIPTLNLSYPNNLRGVVDGNVVQIARLELKTENLEHFTVAMLINHEMRLVTHGI